jgi:hypothetical protein
MRHLNSKITGAIESLQQCHAICSSMALTHCLERGGEHARPQHLRLMLDCAAICAFTADALGRKSQFHTQFAALCAEVCETCEKDCEALQDMEDCVRACHDCAHRCREIARLDHKEVLDRASQHPPIGH